MITKEWSIKLAESVGYWQEHTNTWMCNSEDIEAFAKACYQRGLDDAAKVCEKVSAREMRFIGSFVASADTCVEAIRALGETK